MNEERELNWDDTLSADPTDYITLPEGDYAFTVESVERARHNGSEKVPPCSKAILKLRIDTQDGSVYINHQLLMHTRTEKFLSAFFLSVGLKKKGIDTPMNWNAVPGSTGRAHITLDPDRNDPEKKYNHVKYFYPKEEPEQKAGEWGWS